MRYRFRSTLTRRSLFIKVGLGSLLALLVTLTALNGCASPRISPEALAKHICSLGLKPTQIMVYVDAKKQTLTIFKQNKAKKTYTISTGEKGLGQQKNSFKTPVGLHRINQKIGHRVPKYGIFNKRQYTGSVWEKLPRERHHKDYVSTRILRLEGLQPGFNQGKDWLGRTVDTEARAIYIHGTTMEWKIGFPSTKGCVHMKADDVISVFNEVPEGSLVWIN